MARNLYNMTALALELKKDRTVLGKALADIEPDETVGDRKSYYMATVVNALIAGSAGKAKDASAESTAKIQAHKAELLEMKLDAEKGRLVSIDEVQQVLEPLFTAFKTRVLAIPTRLAKRLASTKEASKIKVVLDKAVRDALEEVSQFKPGAIQLGEKK